MKRSNTWRDVDDFDFGNEEDEEEFRMIDAFAAKPKGKKRAQEQQQRSTSNGRVARTGTGSASGGRRKLEDDTMDWIARHRPTRASQLAVNQKKVDEFTEWARGRQVGTKSSFYSLALYPLLFPFCVLPTLLHSLPERHFPLEVAVMHFLSSSLRGSPC